MPESEKIVLGVPEAHYVRPLLFGLDDPALNVELLVDIPSSLAFRLQQRIGSIRCAFVSPIDYARHGADYLIVPGICVSSSKPSNTIQLFINPNVRNVNTVAVDIRVTSEIILAKIVLTEKFPNDDSSKGPQQFIPMLADRDEMLRKADAALIVNLHPRTCVTGEPFALDLVEEWNDLTGLPYVHGMWVGHEDSRGEDLIELLVRAKEQGVSSLTSRKEEEPAQAMGDNLAAFSFQLGEDEQAGLSEFIRYAYYHRILPDVPDLNFYEAPSPHLSSIN